MLVSENPKENNNNIYDVVVNGETVERGVSKLVGEHYILSLKEDLRAKATLIPVTPDGKQILLG